MRASREGRAERLTERAAKKRAESEVLANRAKTMQDAIPFGQPILVGHHSEKRDRNYRAKIGRTWDRAGDAWKESEDLARRAEAAAANDAIYADAEDPVADLNRKIECLEREREEIKARPHQSWELSNLGANIRRLAARRDELVKLKASPRREYMRGTVKIIEDPDIARIQLVYPGKPDEATRDKLKAHGFRWAPSEGAWQRQLNAAGRSAASAVLGVAI